jgi:hypothetical protein
MDPGAELQPMRIQHGGKLMNHNIQEASGSVSGKRLRSVWKETFKKRLEREAYLDPGSKGQGTFVESVGDGNSWRKDFN